MGLFSKPDTKDNLTNPPPPLDWSPEKVAESLHKTYVQAITIAGVSKDWYARASRDKKRGARAIRVLSILLGALAALFPTIGELLPTLGIHLDIGAGWTVVLFGMAGALLLLDRFFGFTSGWMRYIVAELQLKQIMEEFQLDWETERAGWEGKNPSKAQALQLLARCKAFVSQVNTIVREETDAWVQEFQSTIKYLDESIKARSAITEPGALNLTVLNGDEAAEGWELAIDNGLPEPCKGKMVGKRSLMPGRHEVNVRAVINGKTVQASKVVMVPAGGTCEETLTLS
jgi:hypothetical protein